jgi:hypothetical protein
MEHISVLDGTISNDKFPGLNFSDNKYSNEKTGTNPVVEHILSEGGDDFFRYLNWIGLAKEPNLMVLSSMHHYYYDHDDLIGIRTLINLKTLNQVRHLESFLRLSGHTSKLILSAVSRTVIRKEYHFISQPGFSTGLSIYLTPGPTGACQKRV